MGVLYSPLLPQRRVMRLPFTLPRWRLMLNADGGFYEVKMDGGQRSYGELFHAIERAVQRAEREGAHLRINVFDGVHRSGRIFFATEA